MHILSSHISILAVSHTLVHTFKASVFPYSRFFIVFIKSGPDINWKCYKNTAKSRTEKEKIKIYENRTLSTVAKSALNLQKEQLASKEVEKYHSGRRERADKADANDLICFLSISNSIRFPLMRSSLYKLYQFATLLFVFN